MRVAITADWLNSFGGAERVLLELKQMVPDAPVFTTVWDRNGLPEEMRGWDVRTSFLQRIPFARKRHQAFLPLMPIGSDCASRPGGTQRSLNGRVIQRLQPDRSGQIYLTRFAEREPTTEGPSITGLSVRQVIDMEPSSLRQPCFAQTL